MKLYVICQAYEKSFNLYFARFNDWTGEAGFNSFGEYIRFFESEDEAKEIMLKLPTYAKLSIQKVKIKEPKIQYEDEK